MVEAHLASATTTLSKARCNGCSISRMRGRCPRMVAGRAVSESDRDIEGAVKAIYYGSRTLLLPASHRIYRRCAPTRVICMPASAASTPPKSRIHAVPIAGRTRRAHSARGHPPGAGRDTSPSRSRRTRRYGGRGSALRAMRRWGNRDPQAIPQCLFPRVIREDAQRIRCCILFRRGASFH
jgi:hypothetical protein